MVLPMETEVKLKGRLKHFALVQNAIEKAKSVVKSIPQHESLKLSTDVTLMVANVIENSVIKQCGVDKKEITVNILAELYNLTPDEQAIILEQIEYLLSAKKIKKQTLSKYIRKWIAHMLYSFFFGKN